MRGELKTLIQNCPIFDDTMRAYYVSLIDVLDDKNCLAFMKKVNSWNEKYTQKKMKFLDDDIILKESFLLELKQYLPKKRKEVEVVYRKMDDDKSEELINSI